MRPLVVAAAGALALVGCSAAPTDPHDAAVEDARRGAAQPTAARIAWLGGVPGARPVGALASTDVCVRPESTRIGQSAPQELQCTYTASDAVVVAAVADVARVHEAALARGCRSEGAEDLRSWATAYAGRQLPELTYTCPDGPLVLTGGLPADLAPLPPRIGRTGEVVVAETPVAGPALDAARRSPEPLFVRVAATTTYWSK